MNLDYKLDNWIKYNQNVLMIGKHGVGKTALIKKAFERNGLKWRYFSAATMDPWTDFVGIPKEATKVIGDQSVSYIKMIRPLDFVLGEVEAIFMDEFNRSPKKVRNAVLELIQFKSINGEKFPNLRMVWAAINPEDDPESYDVEKLDMAQMDRFEVHRKIDYKPDVEFFRVKFGKTIADSAIAWWSELDESTKNLVSPRRLEYALNSFSRQGDLRDHLPQESGVSKLLQALKDGPTSDKLARFMSEEDSGAAKIWLKNENNFSSASKYIIESKTLCDWFLPLVPKEKIISLMTSNEKLAKHVMSNVNSEKTYMEICKEILNAKTDYKMSNKIKRFMTQNPDMAKFLSED
jgi:hypothetical protein